MRFKGSKFRAKKREEAMPEKKERQKKSIKKREETVKIPISHLQALEGLIEEQKLRVLLYQQVISQASEELGVDILKKVGSQWSGP